MHRIITAGVLCLGAVVAVHARAVAAPLSCSITTSGFPLGTYNVFALADTTTVLSNAIQYSCTRNSTPVTIALGPSAGTTLFSPRQLLMAGKDVLLYYVSLGGFTPLCGGGSGEVWGNFILSNGTVSYFAVSPPRGVAAFVTAYGCIPRGQNVEAGTYTDSLTVTISF